MPGNEDWKIQRLEEDYAQLWKDMYHGNGKPGMTTRMAKAEESLDAIKYYGRWLICLMGGILVKELVSLIINKH